MTDGAKMLDDVTAFARRYLAFPTEHHHVALALWAVHTWPVSEFYVTPRLVLDSPEPGCGKTRVLEVLALLCRDAKLTLSTTTAALYRRIDAAAANPPTVLQDEADAVFGKSTPNAEDLRALFNAGYKRGATVDRCEGDAKKMRVREFPVFAPAALAGLAGKMPRTILDRAVVLHMRHRSPDEHVAEFRQRDADTAAEPIRRRIKDWAERNRYRLNSARPDLPKGVTDRPAEVWEALVAVADVADPHGEWPLRARAACEHFVLNTEADELSFGLRLLRDIREVFKDADRMFSADIVTALVANEEMEWSDLWGKPLDQARLAKELKRYGVRSSTLRIRDDRAKGYRVDGDDGLGQAWYRYRSPIPTRDTRDTRDFPGQRVTPTHGTRDKRDTGVTPETCSEQPLFDDGTAVTDVTPTDRSTPRDGGARNGYHPPSGPGRCRECGGHLGTQGHTDRCSRAASKASAR